MSEFSKLGEVIAQNEHIMNGDYKKFSPQQIFDACYKESLHSQEAFDEMNNEIKMNINDEHVHLHAQQIPGMLKNKIIQKK